MVDGKYCIWTNVKITNEDLRICSTATCAMGLRYRMEIQQEILYWLEYFYWLDCSHLREKQEVKGMMKRRE